MAYEEISAAVTFQKNVAEFGNQACVAYKKDGAYVDISWIKMGDMVKKLGDYLLSLGIKKGDRVGLFSPNRYEWWVADLAIASIGAVNVPIYSTNSPEESQYILDHSESKLCFVGTEDHLERVLAVKSSLKKLKTIVLFDEPSRKRSGIVTMKEAYRIGSSFKNKDLFHRRLTAIRPHDMATIIYTSGTTGNPKGVMLSHNNFVANLKQIEVDFRQYLTSENVFLSFLPLSHSLERTTGYYLPMAAGLKVAFAEDFSKIAENLKEVKPTFIISVPRLYEKIHAGILSKVAEASAVKRALFGLAMLVASKNLPYMCNAIPRPAFFNIIYNFFDGLIYSKLKAALGMDKLCIAVSGGGPLSVSDAEFFLGMGILICEGFGLTETTPVTNVNRPGEIKPGSVGRALVDTSVRIADDGEVQVKGPQVMLGYFRNSAATKEAFTRDGYFRTGDIGVIDEQGRLSITGRIKDIIVTSGGKNISPQNIENSLKASPFIEQCAIIGDKRKYLAALVIPGFDALRRWAATNGVGFTSNHDLIGNDEVNRLIEGEIAEHTRHFSRAEQVRKFKLLDAEWTQETGELTPTLKIKRRVIESKYAVEIESLYPADRGD